LLLLSLKSKAEGPYCYSSADDLLLQNAAIRAFISTRPSFQPLVARPHGPPRVLPPIVCGMRVGSGCGG